MELIIPYDFLNREEYLFNLFIKKGIINLENKK